MKGFIEVTGYIGTRYVVAINDIMLIKEEREERENDVDKYYATIIFKRNVSSLRTDNSYEEVKKKIEIAQGENK